MDASSWTGASVKKPVSTSASFSKISSSALAARRPRTHPPELPEPPRALSRPMGACDACRTRVTSPARHRGAERLRGHAFRGVVFFRRANTARGNAARSLRARSTPDQGLARHELTPPAYNRLLLRLAVTPATHKGTACKTTISPWASAAARVRRTSSRPTASKPPGTTRTATPRRTPPHVSVLFRSLRHPRRQSQAGDLRQQPQAQPAGRSTANRARHLADYFQRLI